MWEFWIGIIYVPGAIVNFTIALVWFSKVYIYQYYESDSQSRPQNAGALAWKEQTLRRAVQ